MIKEKTPRSSQTKGKFTAADNMTETAIKIPNSHLTVFEIEKNSTIKRDMTAENPAKSPKAFQEPNTLAVFPSKIPSDSKLGINKWKIWNRNKTPEDMITPQNTILAFFMSFKRMEEINIKRNAPSIK